MIGWYAKKVYAKRLQVLNWGINIQEMSHDSIGTIKLKQ